MDTEDPEFAKAYRQIYYYIDDNFTTNMRIRYLENAVRRIRECDEDWLRQKPYVALMVFNLKEHTSVNGYAKAAKLGVVFSPTQLLDRSVSNERIAREAYVVLEPMTYEDGKEKWDFIRRHVSAASAVTTNASQ